MVRAPLCSSDVHKVAAFPSLIPSPPRPPCSLPSSSPPSPPPSLSRLPLSLYLPSRHRPPFLPSLSSVYASVPLVSTFALMPPCLLYAGRYTPGAATTSVILLLYMELLNNSIIPYVFRSRLASDYKQPLMLYRNRYRYPFLFFYRLLSFHPGPERPHEVCHMFSIAHPFPC